MSKKAEVVTISSDEEGIPEKKKWTEIHSQTDRTSQGVIDLLAFVLL